MLRKSPLRSNPEKRRAFIERGRKPIARKVSVAPVNRPRKAKLAEAHFGEYAGRIRALFCVVPGCPETSEACHWKSRGAGGTKAHLFPACNAHHREQHDLGIQTWQAKYGLDLEAIAAHLWRTLGEV